MMNRYSATLTLAGAMAFVTSPSMASTSANDDAAAARIAALEARVIELESSSTDRWLTEERADEIRSLVTDVLADADTRASLMASNMNAGYDNGAVIGDSAGNWQIKTRFLMQQRFVYNNQDEMSATDTNRWGFENTRSKFIITGHVVNPQWFYRIDTNLGTGYGRSGVTNAYLGHDFGDGNKLMMGSFMAPVGREDLVEAQNQLAVERSVVNYAFTGGYVDGIAWAHKEDSWRFTVSLNDGAGSAQTGALAYDTEYSVTGRVEMLFGGNWDQFKDFTSGPGSASGLMVGLGGHWQKGEYGTGASETEVGVFAADVSWEGDGANAFASFHYGNVDTGAMTTNPMGIVVQGGIYLNDDWELFGRYEYADWDTTAEDLSLVTVGVTRYFAGHNMKWTTDFGYGLDALNSGGINGAPNGLTGWRADGSTEDGQFVVRTQWQLFF